MARQVFRFLHRAGGSADAHYVTGKCLDATCVFLAEGLCGPCRQDCRSVPAGIADSGLGTRCHSEIGSLRSLLGLYLGGLAPVRGRPGSSP